MRRIVFAFWWLIGGVLAGVARGADAGPGVAERLLKDRWPASWITHPAAPRNEFGVWLFRKRFELAAKPAHFVVHATGDARYRLFVNGQTVAFGPQRSDAWVCHYESVDLAPWLQAGANVVAAQVWSYGDLAPYGVMSVRHGFLLQGDTEAERAVDTGAGWKVARDEAFAPIPNRLSTYIVVAPGLRIDGAAQPWEWETLGFDDRAWSAARALTRGMPWGWGSDQERWLRPRTIPPMEETPIRFAAVRRANGVTVASDFLAGHAPLTVPPNTSVSLLLDQGVETNAFPQVLVSGGRGARMKLTYTEALIDDARVKGKRDEIDGKKVVGVSDEFVVDGGAKRRFAPLDFRTYRYVQVEIETAAEALRVEDMHGVFTGYPFVERGRFASDSAELKKIWDVGWRTARLCAFETYMDCPYYEQLQYVGDTRIQALISLYVSGDDRLMRNAIEQYDRSRIAEGLTQSRYPSVTPQVINTFSLFWVDMVHDYWMHRTDEAFLRARLPGVQAVLEWFERRIDPATGLLGPLPYWTFVDWTDEWKWDASMGVGGEPPGARSGGSSIVSLQFAATLRRTADLCQGLGRDDLAVKYRAQAQRLIAAAQKLCWDDARQMLADTPEKKHFSQHANTFAVLAGVVDGAAAKALLRRVTDDRSLVQASTYFRFYLLRAMKTAGLGDEYLAQLGPWRAMLDLGLTTFAEKAEPARSDCHAWSASPVYELLATVCGIEPASPGFTTVRIEPHPGALRDVRGAVPHPKGEIRVELTRTGAGVQGAVQLPEGVSGEFVWNGKRLALHPGAQPVAVD